MNCNIIRDLIPLYIDGCLSDESIVFVEEHLENCRECQGLLQIMKESAPVEEVPEKITAKPMERLSVWKASVLQAVLQFVSFLLIVFGVTMEASDADFENGFWAVGLIVPATGFMLSLINWYFVRLYRDRGRFSLVSALSAMTLIIAGYVWAIDHYGISFHESYVGFGVFGLMYGISISIILCILSGVFADKYGKLIGKEKIKPRKTPDPKMFTVIAAFFCVVNSFTPLSIIITALVGYEFDIRSYPLWTISLLLLSGLLAVLMYRYEGTEASKADRVLITIALFMSLFNWVVCLFTGTHGNEVYNAIVIGALIAISALAMFVSVRFIKPPKKGTARAVIAGVLAVLLLQLSVFVAVFGSIGQNTVIQSVDSPTGRYTAELIDSDQGALGGDTLVKVTDNMLSADFGLFTVHKATETVYMGEWGLFKTMTIRWVDKDTLSVGGKHIDVS